MTTISLSPRLVTLINVFTVEPAHQRQLLELLARATETSVRHAPGFLSVSLHRSFDRTKVTMYAQWRTLPAYQAMRENPAPLPYLQQALAIAKFDPGMYEVVETTAVWTPNRTSRKRWKITDSDSQNERNAITMTSAAKHGSNCSTIHCSTSRPRS